MNKPRATTAGENKHTSTEAHMSKVEVKVKAGDGFELGSDGIWQLRGKQERRITSIMYGTDHAVRYEQPTWVGRTGVNGPVLPPSVARAWIAEAGGTVVEEREEEKAGILTVKIYRSTHDGSLWMIDSPTHAAPSDYVFIGTTTIHIAGVTA